MLWANYNLYNPWNELRRMKEELNHVFSGRGNERYYDDFPAINLWSNADDAILTAELPGVEDKDIDLTISGDIVSLKGERKSEELKEEEGYHRQERFNGKFSRTIKLPFAIDSNAIEANLKNGILKVTLSRAESDKQKKITINS